MDRSTSAKDRLTKQILRLSRFREYCTLSLLILFVSGCLFLGMGLASMISPELSGVGTAVFFLSALAIGLFQKSIVSKMKAKETELSALLFEQSTELSALLFEQSLESFPSLKGTTGSSKGVVGATKQLPDTTKGGKEMRGSSGQMFRK